MSRRVAFVLIAAAALAVLLSLGADVRAPRQRARIVFEEDTGAIAVHGLRGSGGVLTVHSMGTDAPAMLGIRAAAPGTVRFLPRVPLVPGQRYRVRFHDGETHLETDVVVPKAKDVPATVITRVDPTADVLPANQLKFYVHFSAPMSAGEAYRRVHLLDDAGREVPRAFLRIDEELWDEHRRRFTLILDPGRIKRGLRSNVEDGAPLRAGGRYRLVIDAEWSDGDGNPLRAAHEKTFRVAGSDRHVPDVREWRVAMPGPGTTEPLSVQFDEPLDRAVLEGSIHVVDARGIRVDGRVEVLPGDRQWRFTPRERWTAGAHVLEVSTLIEDLAGNNLRRLFDTDLRESATAETARVVRVPFRI
jgi:hypothetical protein